MVEILGVILQFLPVIVILFVANLAQKLRAQGQAYMPLAVLAYLMLILIYAALALFGATALLAPLGLAAQPELQAQLDAAMPIQSWAWLGWGILLPSLAGLLLLLKPIRRWIAGFSTLEAGNPLHAAGLSMTMFIPIYLALTLGIGLDTLSTQLAARAEETGQPPVTVGFLWVQTAIFVFIALLGIGWLTRRSWGAALQRLGIVRPTLRQVLIAVGSALVMVPVVMLIEAAASAAGIGIDADVESLTEQLIGPLFQSPWGILSIGLAAGIGEEALFRGAMQPRFGLLFTALLFALVHSNYGITLSTLVVFLLGLLLGWLRIRYNTTTSMIAHAVYNSTLGLLAVLAAQVLSNS
ncbi:CPBP family glutamic-type intramembrane protease [Caldilinea sp.]|uniref:CPBP family glutamic-type intramembrane protease n=1 Tax=Caldilinea sp. TaxID=2293560 RepID=UPI002B8510EC|nr:CPBP family intramembrane metalloprotease [Anaerolineales bacterium]HQY90397.1 CPBP family glutamic-type intramembrane protease [Caldilinea sp.]HRA64629.1 CPBP family glutamic-type intramembrane protease [Caldilinea sp.]